MATRSMGKAITKAPTKNAGNTITPKKVAAPVIQRPVAPPSSSSVNNNSGARQTGNFFGSGSPAAPSAGAIEGTVGGAAGAPSEEDYLAGDGTYQATISALRRQLEGFTSDLDTQRGNRKLDYDRAVKDLGYVAPGQAGGQANWNWDDILTASGRAYQNNSNDYAARGMLQSQAYGDSINNLQRSLMDQYTGIDQSNTQFNSDLDRQGTKARDENTAAAQSARAEAIMRRAAQYGFGV